MITTDICGENVIISNAFDLKWKAVWFDNASIFKSLFIHMKNHYSKIVKNMFRFRLMKKQLGVPLSLDHINIEHSKTVCYD